MISAHEWSSAPEIRNRSDEELLLDYRDAGNREAFDALVHRYEKELFGYLRNYLGDPELAEDAFQQTWMQVYLKCDQFDAMRKFRPWLYAVSTNQAIDIQRKQGRHRMASLNRVVGSDDIGNTTTYEQLLADEASPTAEAIATVAEEQDLVRAAVENLADSERSVVHLVYFGGLKYREAAIACDIPVGTVKSRLHAALKNLAETLPIPA